MERLAAQPGLELAERLGYAVRGALYIVVGLLAFFVALHTGPGQVTDLNGALTFLAANSLGKLILVVSAVGLAAYSVWGLVRAIYDPLHRGHDAPGIFARLGFLTSAATYALVVFFALRLLTGTPATSSTASSQSAVAAILTHPGGGPLTVLLGLVILAMGLGQLAESYRATFASDLKTFALAANERSAAIWLGRFGVASRGVVFLILGYFVIQAGVHYSPSQVQGFGGAFLFLLSQPYGHILLAVIALGFVALGLHSLICARWIRLLGSSG